MSNFYPYGYLAWMMISFTVYIIWIVVKFGIQPSISESFMSCKINMAKDLLYPGYFGYSSSISHGRYFH